MSMELSRANWEKIIQWAYECEPEEACGLLAGTLISGCRVVRRVYPLENKDASPIHFRLDVHDQFAVLEDARANGWIILGNFHSHPHAPALPSDEDLRLAYDKNACYLIVSLLKDEPNLAAFVLKNGSFVHEDLLIVS